MARQVHDGLFALKLAVPRQAGIAPPVSAAIVEQIVKVIQATDQLSERIEKRSGEVKAEIERAKRNSSSPGGGSTSLIRVSDTTNLREKLNAMITERDDVMEERDTLALRSRKLQEELRAARLEADQFNEQRSNLTRELANANSELDKKTSEYHKVVKKQHKLEAELEVLQSAPAPATARATETKVSSMVLDYLSHFI